MIQHKFVNHLDTATQRWVKFKDDPTITKWSAVEQKTMIDDISEEDDKRMVSMPNLPRNKHLAKCGITLSHYKLFKHIVKNKLNDVLILEDDALQLDDLPTDYPKEHIVYIGGYFHQNRMMDQTPVNHISKEGINYCDNSFCIMMTMSYIIPTWKVAEQIINYMDNQKRWRSIDIMVWKCPVKKCYIYPAVYVEEETPSTLRKKRDKTNIHYQLIKWKQSYYDYL